MPIVNNKFSAEHCFDHLRKIFKFVFAFLVIGCVVFTAVATAETSNSNNKDSNPPAKTDSQSSVTNIINPSFIEAYPHLKEHLYQEPKSDFYFGYSIGPLGLIKNRMLFTMNFFQTYYITNRWDWEILSTSFGATSARPASAQSFHFTFRTSPRLRFGETLSIGPVIGMEYVSFPKVQAKITKSPWATEFEEFSSKGYIYGIAISESFGLNSEKPFRLSQIIYQQTYSTEKSAENWTYIYGDNELNKDQDPIKAGPVFLMELGYMF